MAATGTAPLLTDRRSTVADVDPTTIDETLEPSPPPSSSSSSLWIPEPTVLPRHFAYFTKRYFTQFLVRDVKGVPGNNVRLLLHSNNICIVCLDPSHALFTDPTVGTITNVYTGFKRHGKFHDRNVQQNSVAGKRKKNALFVDGGTNLLGFDTSGGQSFRIGSVVRGWLLEVNSRLLLPYGNNNCDATADPTASIHDGHLSSQGVDGTTAATEHAASIRRPSPPPSAAVALLGATLLRRNPLTDGYIAIIAPTKANVAFDGFELISKGIYAETAVCGDED